MTARRGRGRSLRHVVDCDLELRPLMNVFIVLIPMLLMSAVFMEIRVIETSSSHASSVASAQPAKPALQLALHIRSGAYVLMGDGIASIEFMRADTARKGVLDAATTERLTAALAQIVALHPDNHEIRIVAEPGTHYQEIVMLMDLARTAGLSDAALAGARGGA